jgi:NADPH:quinone reductase-like Zn-dependent oxidoreductase
MKAARIHRFGPPDVIVVEEVPRPSPSAGEIVVRVAAAGVGPWDALIREGKSKVSPLPPLTLGSDLSGVVEVVGAGVKEFEVGDEVYGVTNAQFCGAQAEYALAFASMMAHKPSCLTHVEASSVPVVAVTAWQMLFEYAYVVAGQTVLILGAAGNVGAYAVQFAARAGLHVIALAGSQDLEFVRGLGAETVLDHRAVKFEEVVPRIDVVIDTVGGDTVERSVRTLKPGGIVVSVVSTGPVPEHNDVRAVFFYVEVSTARLRSLTELIDRAKLSPHVGSVLPLRDARVAHQMLGGAVPYKRGKIVLEVAT